MTQSSALSAALLTQSGLRRQAGTGLALLATAMAAVLVVSRSAPEFGIFGVLGLGFGVVLQRSRFCFNAAFRDLLQFRSGRTMKGVIVGMAVATAGFGLHMHNLMPNPMLGSIAPEAHATPLSLALVLGGILFGFGMVLAGGCVSGSLYRMGEGYAASYVSFAGLSLGLLLAGHSWNWWYDRVIRPAPVVWFPRYLGYGGAVALTLAGLLTAFLVVLWIESRGGVGAQEFVSPSPAATFREKVRAMVAAVVGRGWPAAVGGTAAGLLNIFSYNAHMPWRVVGELSRWANTAAAAVGLAPGPLKGTEDLSACTLSVGGGVLTHALLLNGGLLAGSLVAALLSNEFKWRRPRNPVRYLQSGAGGIAMGYGAGIALGCTVGQFFSAIPSLALNGWVFAGALAVGAWIGLQAIRRIP